MDPFSEEGASDDEGNVDRVATHNDLVEAFENASTSSSRNTFHRFEFDSPL